MQLQVKLQTTGDIMYLEANKNQTKYLLTYLQVSK